GCPGDAAEQQQTTAKGAKKSLEISCHRFTSYVRSSCTHVSGTQHSQGKRSLQGIIPQIQLRLYGKPKRALVTEGYKVAITSSSPCFSSTWTRTVFAWRSNIRSTEASPTRRP